MCGNNFIFAHLNDEHLNNLTTTFRKVTVNDILRGVSSYKDYDALGRIVYPTRLYGPRTLPAVKNY